MVSNNAMLIANVMAVLAAVLTVSQQALALGNTAIQTTQDKTVDWSEQVPAPFETVLATNQLCIGTL